MVFISHRLEEMLQVVDRIIVMRDGHRVGTLSREEATEDEHHPPDGGPRGRPVSQRGSARSASRSWRCATSRGNNGVKNVSFTVRKGEIVGLAGLVGAGRTEVARLICGVDHLTEGSILLDGKEVKIHNTGDAVAGGHRLGARRSQATWPGAR